MLLIFTDLFQWLKLDLMTDYCHLRWSQFHLRKITMKMFPGMCTGQPAQTYVVAV